MGVAFLHRRHAIFTMQARKAGRQEGYVYVLHSELVEEQVCVWVEKKFGRENASKPLYVVAVAVAICG